jgi:hypothetical protein
LSWEMKSGAGMRVIELPDAESVAIEPALSTELGGV